MTNATLQPDGMQPTGDLTPEHRSRNSALVWGAILLGVGIVTLLSNLGIFEKVVPFFWALLFAAGGLGFLYVFLRDTQKHWWAAIPAFALFGLAGTVTVSEYAPSQLASLGGAVFLGGLGLGFLAVYLVRREHWWALIPAGTMLSLAATAAVTDSGFAVDSDLGGGIFMLGLGITFLVVALVPGRDGKGRWWAFIPSAVLLIMGVMLLFEATQYLAYMGYVWGAVLVVAGGALLYKALGQKDQR